MKHVLVIRLSAFGDVAIMAPLIELYASHNHDIRFTVAGPPLLQPLFEGMDNVETFRQNLLKALDAARRKHPTAKYFQ